MAWPEADSVSLCFLNVFSVAELTVTVLRSPVGALTISAPAVDGRSNPPATAAGMSNVATHEGPP